MIEGTRRDHSRGTVGISKNAGGYFNDVTNPKNAGYGRKEPDIGAQSGLVLEDDVPKTSLAGSSEDFGKPVWAGHVCQSSLRIGRSKGQLTRHV